MKDFLDTASEAYYSGEPIISDAEFDILADKHNYGDRVGYTITDGVPHTFPMSSLQKVFDIKDAPISITGLVKTPKLDGAAVSLLYVGGKFVQGLTRGDGKIGRDITDKLAYLVPSSISTKTMVQITGEVVAPSSILNARNYASGALNLKKTEEFLEREIAFIAYECTPNTQPLYSSQMLSLEYKEFNTVLDYIVRGIGDNTYTIDAFPTDGVVYRVDSYAEYRSLGNTSHHPKGAFALKEMPQGVITKLLDVVWQVGKSGVVSPVAILEPVLVGDATVSRATLHNIKYINDLNLEIGCNVEIIRAGEIIPRVLKRSP